MTVAVAGQTASSFVVATPVAARAPALDGTAAPD
jgi:hypothetical protein